ncbi:hypothetical protein N8D56_09260 [Devosia sp. A8/3-2]|nr:hypothetical protein N8D56_09260 [Devosia sp. A8/3-2]
MSEWTVFDVSGRMKPASGHWQVRSGIHRRLVEPEVNTNITGQLGSARDALLRNDLKEGEALEESRALLQSFIYKQPDFWMVQFDRLIGERFNAVDKALHDKLAGRGQHAIDKNNVDDLRAVVIEMIHNMIRGADETDAAILSGLMV